MKFDAKFVSVKFAGVKFAGVRFTGIVDVTIEAAAADILKKVFFLNSLEVKRV